jgi:hypothetical protein
MRGTIPRREQAVFTFGRAGMPVLASHNCRPLRVWSAADVRQVQQDDPPREGTPNLLDHLVGEGKEIVGDF